MSYAVQHPAAATPAPTATPRRPASVGIASALLIVMAVAGLAYAVATLAIAPGTVDRFRGAAGTDPDVDGFVTVMWIGAAIGAVLAVILFALYVVLALGLRRGSNGIRIATLVVCALGLAAGCASALTVAVQRGGDSAPGSLGAALADAYPGSWIPLNVGLAVAQMAGYVLVGALLLAAPRTFFGRAPKPAPPDPFAAPQPGYGGPAAAPGYGGPAAAPGYGGPAAAPGYGGAVAPGYGGAGAYGAPGGYSAGGYGAPGSYGAPQAGYPAQPVYGAPYPAGPAPVAENPDEPSPWAPPRPTTPTAPAPSDSAAPAGSVEDAPPSTSSQEAGRDPRASDDDPSAPPSA